MTLPTATPLPTALRNAALRWIADDPSPIDRAELQRIVADAMGGRPGATEELTHRMAGPISFGTAGLRGPLRAGPSGMNLAVVRRAAAGIGAHLRANGGPGRIVVIGHDARHRSREFAEDAARVLAAAGFRVLLAPGPLPTPMTAFAVRHLDAAAGMQVTASHNPPQDNGLKVYLQAGAQIVAPVDAAIEAAIAAVGPAVSVDAAGTPQPWPDDLVSAYLARAAAQARGTARTLRIAATPMHGVGGEPLVHALALAGFTDVHIVGAQAVPDADFPTVAFPNPEEPGATDLLLALAAEVNADLAIANDPDADRCAIGIPTGDDGWRMLRGDETGVLLGDQVLRTLDRAAHPDPLVATTIVSSSMLRTIAAAHGARYDETLTGFKWIVRGRRRRRYRIGVRLRGSARVVRRPGCGEGQGRHLGRRGGRRPRRDARRPGRDSGRSARRAGQDPRTVCHRPVVGAGGRSRRHRGGDATAPCAPSIATARRSGDRHRGSASAHGRGHLADRTGQSSCPTLRHGAEAQGLSRGHRAGE